MRKIDSIKGEKGEPFSRIRPRKLFSCFLPNKPVFQCIPYGKSKTNERLGSFLPRFQLPIRNTLEVRFVRQNQDKASNVVRLLKPQRGRVHILAELKVHDPGQKVRSTI